MRLRRCAKLHDVLNRVGHERELWYSPPRVTSQRFLREKQRLFIVAATLVALLFPRALMAQFDGPIDTRPAANRPIQIEAPLFEGGEGRRFFYFAAREFEKRRPDVSVNMYLDPRITDKVRVRVLEGSFFEVSNAFINWWPMIYNGDVMDMTALLNGPNWEGDSTWRESFLPGALNQWVHEERIYGIPFAYFVTVIWYNKQLFRENGWQPPVTWDEFYQLCERIRAANVRNPRTGDVVAPLTFQGRYPQYARAPLDSVYYQLAGPQRWVAQKRLVPGSFNNDQYIQAVATIQRMASYFQRGALGMDHTGSQQQFFNGNAAMIPCGSWLKSEMLDNIPPGFELGCFNFPAVSNPVGDPNAIAIGSNAYFVMRKSKHPEVAAEFLRFLTSREMAGIFSRMTDIPSAVRGASDGNLSADMDDLMAIVNRAQNTFGTLPGEGFPEMEQYAVDALAQVVGRRAPPAQIAAHLESAALTVRSRAEKPDQITVNHVWKPAILLGLLALALVYWLWTTGRSLRRSAGPRVQSAGRQRLSWPNILLFVAPAVLVYTVFVIVPSLRSFVWSVHRWNGLTDMQTMPFIGLLNFRRLLLESDPFWIALGNNLFLMFVIPMFVIPLALFLAACISRGIGGAKLFRVVFFFPNLLGAVAVALLWSFVYNAQGGLINTALVNVGHFFGWIGIIPLAEWFRSFEGFAWLSADNLYWALIPMSIWGACGFNMVLYLAAMESVPESLYESATIDGASAWRQFWSITIPMIWDILTISIVFMVIGGMKAFEIIWLLTNQMPTTQNHVIATRMVATMFGEFKVGEATAIAVLLFLMVFLGTAATLRGLRRESVEMG